MDPPILHNVTAENLDPLRLTPGIPRDLEPYIAMQYM
jgi:hypothetical protein